MRKAAFGTIFALLGMLTTWSVGLPRVAGGEESSATDPQVDALARTLVARLGHDEFAVRERATEQLMAIGVGAIEALEEAAASPNREIRRRSRVVLTIIQQVDFQRRLQAFADDRQGRQDYRLPGWQRYRELAGNDQAARSLFVAMQTAEPELMRAVAVGPEETARALNQRCQDLRQGTQWRDSAESLGSVAALLLAATVERVPLTPETNSTLYMLCVQSGLRNAIAGQPKHEAVVKILTKWVLREDSKPAYCGLLAALQFEIKEILPRAEAILGETGSQVQDRKFAILAVARYGSQSDVPLLEKLLDDEAVCDQSRAGDQIISTLVRDVALAALLHLTRQDPVEYGYSRLQRTSSYVFVPASLGFESDDARRQAMAKWRTYRAGIKQTPE